MKKITILLCTLFLMTSIGLEAQYFGRNKPRYRNFDFKVKETPHFDVYYYLKNEDAVNRVAQWTEQWYDLHQEVVYDTFYTPSPIIFYNNHAEFQQTNAISGAIGVGTGGVTEGLKNRVVMPITFTNQQTMQVLGHELVHAFQFHMIIGGDSTSLRSLANLPLWLVEGMAEYMSIGRVDPFTAMWMRDAILKDEVPSLRDMYNPKYFPYRYGQAVWSFLTGLYGDDVIKPLFYTTAKYGLDVAVDLVLDTDLKTLSSQWQNALKTYYEPHLGEMKERFIGKKLISEDNSGRINVSPTISPNGRYVVYLSEKDLFSTDLYVADARSGKILNKMASLVKDSDLDAFNYLESAGAWSPNSKEFAFIGFSKGQNIIVIKEALSGKTLQQIKVPGVLGLANPVWSPDGKNILVTGSVEGQTDLYLYNIRSGRTTRLTDDVYSEILSNFSPDGKHLAFSYDKRSFDQGRTFGKYTFDIAVMNLSTKEIEILDVFQGADNLNPNFNHEGDIYFVSDRDGYKNLYLYERETGAVNQMTELLTGISGITRYSPSISASTKRDRVLFTHYYEGKYSVYRAEKENLLNKVVDKDSLDFSAGTLPIVGLRKNDIVNSNLNNIDVYPYVAEENFKNKRYAPKFQLDYVGGGAGIGVSNSTFGSYTGLQGGIDLLFSDMLGNNQLFTQLALNGTIYDFGGQVAYLNRKSQLAWGLSISHIPSLTGWREILLDVPLELDGTTYSVNEDRLSLLRVFDESIGAFAHYPFSTTLRLEGGVNVSRRFFRMDQISNYFDDFGFYLPIPPQKEKIAIGDTVRFNQYFSLVKGFSASVNIGLVGDNSYFGLTAPLVGQRYRLSLERSYGINNYYGVLADYRRYFRMAPFTFAFRGLGYLRFENDVNSLYPFYIGQMGFVRGYDSVFDTNPQDRIGGIELGQLLGSKIGMFNFEIRMPFTGPRRLAFIPSNIFFTDLALFFDAGVAFDEFSHFGDGEPIDTPSGVKFLEPEIASSVGISLRINLFGALILEPYYAWPLQSDTKGQFGLNFVPGW